MTTLAEIREQLIDDDTEGLPRFGRVFPIVSEDDARELMFDMLEKAGYREETLGAALAALLNNECLPFIRKQIATVYGYRLIFR